MRTLILSFTIFISLLSLNTSIFAQISVSDTLSSSVTWTLANSPYQVTGNVVVAQGATLTIEPGTEVRFTSGTSLIVEGVLLADGTNASQITFTSDAASPVKGDWGSIRFNNTGDVGSVLDNVILEYGGGGSSGALITYKTGAYGFPVTNSEFRFSDGHGIDLRASSPAISNSTFRDNNGYGVFSDLALNFQVDSSTVIRNTQGGVRVPINSTPTIHASVIDSNGTGIYIDNGAIPEISFNDIRANNTGIRVIEAGSVSPVITDNTISGNSTIGVQNDGGGLLTTEYNFWGHKSGPDNFSNPSGTGDAVSNNVDFTPWLYGATLPVREITANPSDGDIWYADSVYYVQNNLTVGVGATLTIQPGAVVKFVDATSLTVNGTLIADGTEEDKIFFTSQYDDGVGGDSNGDARATQPERGNWRRLLIESNSDNSVLNYVDIRFGGYSNSSLYLNSNTVSVTNVLVTNSDQHGIYINNKPLSFNHITANNNRYDGIHVYNNGSEMDNITAEYNGQSGIAVRLNGLSEDVNIDSAITSNNNYEGIAFFEGGANRAYGLSAVTNSVVSNNNRTGIRIDENGVGQFSMSNNTITNNGEYGASIFLNSAFETNATIHNNTFSDNGYSGLRTTAAQIYSNMFENNEMGISAWGRLGNIYNNGSGTDGNIFVDNTFNDVLGLEGYFLNGTLSTVFPEAINSAAYMFQRVNYHNGTSWGIAVGANDTLTINPGVIIKSWPGRYSNGGFGTYDGMIIAEGTEVDPIVFTSWRDDSIGGDTDAVDDTVSAKPDDWGGVFIQDIHRDNNGISKFSRLSHVHIKYAHRGLHMEMGNQLFADELDNITISDSYMDGIYLDYGRFTISNSVIKNTLRYQGIIAYYNADVTVRNSIIRNNGHNGLYAYDYPYDEGGSFFREVSNSVIENNGHDGMRAAYLESSSTILGNTIQNNGRDGIFYFSELDSTDIYFTGNTIKNNDNNGIISSAAIFIDNHFEGNEFGISLHGKLGHRYTDEYGEDGNTFVDNTFNNVLGLEGRYLKGTLSTDFPEAITSGAYMFQKASNTTGHPAVAPNDTLQINPGVLIKSWNGNFSNGAFGTYDGMIIAEGTEADPIVFTSWRDDSIGGDTDAVDDTVSARSNDWGGMFISDRSNDNAGVAKFSRLSHVHIKYAHRGLQMEMGNQLFADELDNITISDSYADGIYLDYGRFTISNSVIENTLQYQGITAYYNADVTVRNSIIRNNGQNGLHAYDYPYDERGSFFREVSNSVIENNGHDGIYVLNSTSPMTFQSNTIQSNGRNGMWTTISEAGTDTVLTISGNNISNNAEAGILSSRAIIVDDTLEGNKYPIGVTGELSKPGTINDRGNYYEGNVIQNNQFNEVVKVSGGLKGVLGGTKPNSFTENLVYGVGNVSVADGDTLVINKGTIIKNNSGVRFDIRGHFEAVGTASEKIVFTSILDDTYGGNTNGDTTNVQPTYENWSGLYLRDTSTDSSEIKNVISRYANIGLQLYNSDALVDSSYFSNSRYGVYVNSNSTPTLRSSDFHSNQDDGVHVVSGSNPQIQLSNFYNNGNNGLYQGAGTDIIAENNYWGDASGPFVDQGADQNLQGTGDRIYINSGTVDYREFLTGRNGILLGDVSENGTITPFDASQILLHTVLADTLTGTALAAADVSGNGDVSPMDASYILQYVVGTISGFPGQGKRQQLDYTKVLALNFESGNGYTDIKLEHLGEANLFSAQIDLIIPGNLIQEVKFIDSPYDQNVSFLHNIQSDTIRIALASGIAMDEEGVLGILRLMHDKEDKGVNIKDLITYKTFALNETDITDHMNQVYSSNEPELGDIPKVFNLNQNYPNPFNPTTNISFDLPQNGEIHIRVYNMLGQLVQTLVNERQQAGSYTMTWNASQFGSGTYLLRLDFKGDNNQSYSQVRKMVLIK